MNIDIEIYDYRKSKEIKYKDYILECRANDTSIKKSIRTSIGYIDIYIYYPEDKLNEAVYFNFHGGGFVLGYHELDSYYCRLLSQKTGSTIINVDYCIAPEYKFPLSYTTSKEVIEWCYHNSQDLNISNNCFLVGGNSAGGNIAAGLVQLLNRESNIIKGLVMNYSPCVQSFQEKKAFDTSKAIKPSRIEQYINWQFEDYSDLESPIASPLKSDPLLYPKVLFNVAEFDSLLDEEIEFNKKLVNSGVQTDFKIYKGCRHGFTHEVFDEFDSKASEDAWNRISKFIRKVSEEL